MAELFVNDFSDFSYYDPNATVKDGIIGMVRVWREIRLLWLQQEEGDGKEFLGKVQGMAYSTIQELRKSPLTDRLIADSHEPDELKVWERRSMMRLVS